MPLTCSSLQQHFRHGMEKVASTFGSGVMKRCRRRRLYRRLSDKNNVRGRSRWKLWRIRVMPKLQQKSVLQMKLLRRFRDGYVKRMLCFARQFVQLNNGTVFLFRRISKAPQL
ncbi:hypothetical protein POTOM_041879 [Populus tomentosa]|uniref:Uncharacterized protein n=1 Tax=Populus tomentosa TaxID=118781 RepID=A0A8X8C9I2_POPTO|nr:hypothetical protein POTOM_041879 [Populus tomentosa]